MPLYRVVDDETGEPLAWNFSAREDANDWIRANLPASYPVAVEEYEEEEDPCE